MHKDYHGDFVRLTDLIVTRFGGSIRPQLGPMLDVEERKVTSPIPLREVFLHSVHFLQIV